MMRGEQRVQALFDAASELAAHANANGSMCARVALMRKVCGAVSEAHRELIVRRDLKPGNILVDAAGIKSAHELDPQLPPIEGAEVADRLAAN
jgi:serine/threonine protein kinase